MNTDLIKTKAKALAAPQEAFGTLLADHVSASFKTHVEQHTELLRQHRSEVDNNVADAISTMTRDVDSKLEQLTKEVESFGAARDEAATTAITSACQRLKADLTEAIAASMKDTLREATKQDRSNYELLQGEINILKGNK